jgi:hypothetical protein
MIRSDQSMCEPEGTSTYGWIADVHQRGGICSIPSPKTGIGIVALSNVATEDGVDDLGLHLMDARYPLSVQEGSSNEVAVDAKAPDGYVGSYELSANFILTVTREVEPGLMMRWHGALSAAGVTRVYGLVGDSLNGITSLSGNSLSSMSSTKRLNSSALGETEIEALGNRNRRESSGLRSHRRDGPSFVRGVETDDVDEFTLAFRKSAIG